MEYTGETSKKHPPKERCFFVQPALTGCTHLVSAAIALYRPLHCSHNRTGRGRLFISVHVAAAPILFPALSHFIGLFTFRITEQVGTCCLSLSMLAAG